jgi:hypothetical protein
MSLGIGAKRLSHSLMHATIRIECCLPNNKHSTGTSFVFNTNDDVIILVSNRHVIENSTIGEFVIAEGDKYNEPILGQGISITMENFASRWSFYPDDDVDLAFMPFRQIIQECKRQRRQPFFTSINSDTIPTEDEWKGFISVEDILMIGYPRGLWDEVNNIPFFMKGMTSTHPDVNYKGKEEFAVHIPIYPGSSGSPILLLSEQFYKKSRSYKQRRDYARLLGIAYKHFRYQAEGKIIPKTDQQDIKISSEILLDLGVANRSTKLKEFESMVEERLSNGEELRI